MAQDADIRRIVEKLREYVPPEVDIQTVWKIVKEYFPESECKKGKKRGSHLYYVK